MTDQPKVLTFDSYGDGWVDPFGEATEFWKLTGATGSQSGNLMKGHAAARSTFCLADGEYDFSAPGAVSWVSPANSQPRFRFGIKVERPVSNADTPRPLSLGCL